MKKIAILVNTLQSGGAEKQSIFLLNALKTNYPTIFIVFHGNLIEDKLLQFIEGDNFTLIRLEGNLFKKLFHLYELFRVNQITHLFTYLTNTNFFGSLVAKLAGVNFIYGSIRNSLLPGWKIILDKIASNYFSTGTILNNYEGELVFKKKGFANTLVIPNGYPDINLPITRPEKPAKKIITVGRFVEQKDYNTSLKAIFELKQVTSNFVYQIVGYGKLEQIIRKKVVEFGLGKHVEIFINPNNILELLNDSDIYLSTSLFEGTSNSIMEAMDASLPIVTTNVGDNARLVQEGINGFLHPVNDFKSIAKSLETLINDYKLRIKFGIKSNHILNENYSFEKFKQNYLEIINKT